MKFTKQARMVLLVVLASASILPGCGKSKNNSNNGAIVGGPVVVGPVGSTGAPCIVSNPYYAVQGTPCISNATGWLYGTAPMNAGAIGGALYQKTNGSGDTLYVTVAGSPQSGQPEGTQVAVHVSVSPGPGTVSYFNLYCGGYNPTHVKFSGTALVSGSPGAIGGNSPRLEDAIGCGLLL